MATMRSAIPASHILSARTCFAGIFASPRGVVTLSAMVDDIAAVITGVVGELNPYPPAPLPHEPATSQIMPTRTRKLIGTIALLILLAIYVPAAVSIGARHFVDASGWVQLAYFLAAGLLWVLPAALLVRWMQRPSRQEALTAGRGSTTRTTRRRDRARFG